MTARAQGVILQLVYSERRTSWASASPFPPALSVPCRAIARARTRPEPCLFFPRRDVRIVCARTHARTHAGPAGLYSRRAHEPVLLILLGSAGFLVSVACLAGAVVCRSCAWDGCADAVPSTSAAGSDSPACAQASAFNTHIVHGVADCARNPSAQPHACTHACTPRAGLGRARLTAWP